VSGQQSILLTALPPSRAQERFALLVSASLFITFLAAIPLFNSQLPAHPGFMAFVDSNLFLIDLIIATLLYAQFSIVRTWGLLLFASGFLFRALIIVPREITFPGVLGNTFVSGAGLQISIWLSIFWHLAIPLSAIGYSLLKNTKVGHAGWSQSSRNTIVGAVAAVCLLVLALLWLSTSSGRLLPVLMTSTLRTTWLWRGVIAPPILALFVASIIVMWRRRASLLDLWLLVSLWGWFIEAALLSSTNGRYTFVWYAGWTIGLVSSTFVLLTLVAESSMMYNHLAMTVTAHEREREGRRMRMEILVASFAHELQQPLSAIVINGQTGLNLIAHTPPDLDELQATLADITEDGRRASEIIESIRALSGTGTSKLNLLDLGDLVRQTVGILRIELKAHRIVLELDSAQNLPRVMGNRRQLLQVILNLMTNAIDSMAGVKTRPRVLRVRFEKAETARVSIIVEDSGIGIDPKLLDRIFDPFFSTKSHGMGLGLAICRSIIEAHGGQLSAAPGDAYGSTFRVDLPSAADDRPAKIGLKEAAVG
jgi:signal transduction histidine kinase